MYNCTVMLLGASQCSSAVACARVQVRCEVYWPPSPGSAQVWDEVEVLSLAEKFVQDITLRQLAISCVRIRISYEYCSVFMRGLCTVYRIHPYTSIILSEYGSRPGRIRSDQIGLMTQVQSRMHLCSAARKSARCTSCS